MNNDVRTNIIYDVENNIINICLYKRDIKDSRFYSMSTSGVITACGL
jgi:hypothetical protein